MMIPHSWDPLLFHPLNNKTLYVLIPVQQCVHTRVGKVSRPEVATHPCDKLRTESGDLKRAPGKLHTIIVDHGGVGPITEARRHGIAPVPKGHPAYRWMRDGDGDGVVCE